MFILKLNLKIIRLVKNTNINFHYVCNPNLTYILTARITYFWSGKTNNFLYTFYKEKPKFFNVLPYIQHP